MIDVHSEPLYCYYMTKEGKGIKECSHLFIGD